MFISSIFSYIFFFFIKFFQFNSNFLNCREIDFFNIFLLILINFMIINLVCTFNFNINIIYLLFIYLFLFNINEILLEFRFNIE